MKEYSMEMPKHPQTAAERLGAQVTELIKNYDNAIAVEVYGHGIGRLDEDTVTSAELENEAAEYSVRFRSQLAELLQDSTVQSEALVLFDDFAAGNKGREEVLALLQELLLASAEQNTEVSEYEQMTRAEFADAAAELEAFVEDMILGNERNLAQRSKWGNAKLAYEKGDSSRLLTALEELAISSSDAGEKERTEKFIHFLKHQKFTAQ